MATIPFRFSGATAAAALAATREPSDKSLMKGNSELLTTQPRTTSGPKHILKTLLFSRKATFEPENAVQEQ
jgi:hypothetical protein